jgi:hypothetical protein
MPLAGCDMSPDRDTHQLLCVYPSRASRRVSREHANFIEGLKKPWKRQEKTARRQKDISTIYINSNLNKINRKSDIYLKSAIEYHDIDIQHTLLAAPSIDMTMTTMIFSMEKISREQDIELPHNVFYCSNGISEVETSGDKERRRKLHIAARRSESESAILNSIKETGRHALISLVFVFLFNTLVKLFAT